MNNLNRTPDMIVLHEDDNVATALTNLSAGSAAWVAGPSGRLADLILRDEIRLGHKAALRGIDAGALAVKHGAPFGRATAPIAVGEHVHIHNILSLSQETDLAPQGGDHV